MINDIETGGGAATAASRLAEGLCQNGHEVIRIVAEIDRAVHPWQTIRLVPTKQRWLRGMFTLSRNPNLAPANAEALLDVVYHRLVIKQLNSILKEIRPDIINIHNIHAARWSPRIVVEAAQWAPVVWTLHDTWSFTGRCAVESECKLFQTSCNSSCPTANDYPRLPRWRVRSAWEERRSVFHLLPNLIAVPPSRWLAGYARQGLWQAHHIEIIPYGLDTTILKPIPKPEARELLEIPGDRPVVMMASGNISDRLKGGWLLNNALREVETPLTLLILGGGTWPWPLERHRLIPMGYVGNLRLLALLYSAADFLVHPTLADNLPLVLLEAIACGTPCVSTPVGGCPEIVRPGKSGWLAKDTRAQSLAQAINQAVSTSSSWAQLSRSCRALAEREYKADLMVDHYQRLFQSLIKRRS